MAGHRRPTPHHFYPRPPRGGRPKNLSGLNYFQKFLSTPSARRATRGSAAGAPPLAISIHALREEGDLELGVHNTRYHPFLSTPSARRATARANSTYCAQLYFYPRPPRGGRPSNIAECCTDNKFLSTPSARRATFSFTQRIFSCSISIHALREEGDQNGPRGRFFH